jgi:hypothetical protein
MNIKFCKLLIVNMLNTFYWDVRFVLFDAGMLYNHVMMM